MALSYQVLILHQFREYLLAFFLISWHQPSKATSLHCLPLHEISLIGSIVRIQPINGYFSELEFLLDYEVNRVELARLPFQNGSCFARLIAPFIVSEDNSIILVQ